MATVIYRQLSPTYDYVFGQNAQDFYSDLQAVAQSIFTRLRLIQGSFWLSLTSGLPLFSSIVGTSGSQANIDQINTIISNIISTTPYVTQIISYNSTFSAAARQYQFTCQVQTQFSGTPITISSGAFAPGTPPQLNFSIVINSQEIPLI
jgi:hypothetical protein